KKVELTYSSGTKVPLVLTYDATCAGTNSWRYDDPIKPTRVVLCPDTCSTVQADANGILNAGFACEQVIFVIQ
ncbi:MAG TPA: VWA domain-containing protein, partial [Polyangia bacterium]